MVTMALFSENFFPRFSMFLVLLGPPVLLSSDVAGMTPEAVLQIKEEFLGKLSFARMLLATTVENDPTLDLVLMQNPKVPLASRIDAAKRVGAVESEVWDFLNGVAVDPGTLPEECVKAAVALDDSLVVMEKIQDPSISEKTLLETAVFLLDFPDQARCKEKATSILFDLCSKLPEESTLSEKERSEARSSLSSCLQELGENYDRFFVSLYPLWTEMADNQDITWSERFNIIGTALEISGQGERQTIMDACFSKLKGMVQDPSVPAVIRCDAAERIFFFGLERYEAEKKEVRDILIEMASDPQNSPHLRLEVARGLEASAHEDLQVFAETDAQDLVTEIVNTASEELLLPFMKSVLDDPAMSVAQGLDLLRLKPLFNVKNEVAISPYLLEIVQSLELSLDQRWDAAQWLVSIVDRTEDSEDGRLLNTGLSDTFAAFLERKSR